MAELSTRSTALPPNELDRMHDLFRRGGQERQKAPHIVYPEATCPHDGCEMPMQAIDFRLEDHGRAVHDPLVRALVGRHGLRRPLPALRGLDPFHDPRQTPYPGRRGRAVSPTPRQLV